jgi:hypothetical protein
MQSESERYQDADDVLRYGEDGSQQEEPQHVGTPDLHEGQARAEPDRREERYHQRVLKRRVELHQRHALAARDQDGDRDCQPAEYGRGQVVAGEDRYETPQAFAEQQRYAGEGERLYKI